jgi:hypothetical protein
VNPPRQHNHPAALTDEELLEQCTIGQSRASGPGGQHRNKVSTQITLTHHPTGLAATAGERRSQRENKSLALRRLRLKLAVDHRVDVPAGEIGSDLIRRRLTRPKRAPSPPKERDEVFEQLGITLRDNQQPPPAYRLAINPKHRDYPAILAEVMDAVAAAKWEPKAAAARFGISQSQLLKLIKHHPHALGKLNEEREKRGKHPFH